MWYDMIWIDIRLFDRIDVLYDMIGYDMIWYDRIGYDAIRYDMAWYDMSLRMLAFFDALSQTFPILIYFLDCLSLSYVTPLSAFLLCFDLP